MFSEFTVRGLVVAHVARTLKLDITKARAQFPCSNPISCDMEFLCGFANQDTLCCYKYDGKREFVVVIHSNGYDFCCVLDRAWNCRVVARTKADRAEASLIHVLDGENVDGVLHVHDSLVFEETSVLSKPFELRLRMYNAAISDIRSTFELGFELVPKSFCPVEEFMSESQMCDAKNDGLIFVHRHARATIGKDQHIMKWKPCTQNTIDCFVSKNFAYVVDGARKVKVKNCDIKDPNLNGVYELEPVVKTAGVRWRVVRLRKDKTVPNSKHTYEQTLKAVTENISHETLAAAFMRKA